MLKSLFHWVLRKWIERRLRGKELWFFYGIRRSGNHACINWVANAHVGESVQHKQLGFGIFFEYGDQQVFFINSFAQVPPVELALNLWRYRAVWDACPTIFLSREDTPNDTGHFMDVPHLATHVIGITRSMPNVLASRLKKYGEEIVKPNGGIAGVFVVNSNILQQFFEARNEPKVWHYDEWLHDPAWRRRFLDALGLGPDLMPGMSIQGGGSSFGQESGAKTARHALVPCPEAVKAVVMPLLERLPEEEQAVMRHWMEGNEIN